MDNDKRDEQRYTLEELGLTRSLDSYGKDHITITFPPDPRFGVGQPQAGFDPIMMKWQLTITASTKFREKFGPVFKRNHPIASNEFPPRAVPWTEMLPRTEHVEHFLNNVDWASTALGPLERWPPLLQAYLNITFADSQAATVYWGDDLCALYNHQFHRLVSIPLARPEDLLGAPFTQMWPEIWNDFEPMFKSCSDRGTGLDVEVSLFPVVDGFPEETWWHGSFLPIRDASGLVRGFYNRAREITRDTINERRSRVLTTITTKSNVTRDCIFKHTIHCFSLADKDFPLVVIYSAHEDVVTGKCRLKLQGADGLPTGGHPLLPNEMELFEGSQGFIPYFRKAKGKNKPLVLHEADGTLPKNLLDGFCWKGHGEPSRNLAILPLSTSDRLLAIVMVGLNPRRSFDDEQEGFLNTLLRSMSATVACAIDQEEARNRADRLAKQFENTEKSIRELAEYGLVGIARFSLSGNIEWANDQFYEITDHGRGEEDHYEMSFMDTTLPEDRELSKKAWFTLSQDHRIVSVVVRLKKTWLPPPSPDSITNAEHPVCVLASGYPIMEGGEPKAYAISVTDISRFKWAEDVQTRSAVAAKEAKRLQENFIDIISHEMRNPLSAITQLSDAISSSLEDFDDTKKGEDDARKILNSNVDSANTILLCAAHQKRVIDDVLTLSKLDSMLLSITPVAVQPYRIVENVLRMFEAEFHAADIDVRSEKAKSYTDQNVDWVCLDPSRLTQIFINLITNAVKFTKLEERRHITVKVGAIDRAPPSLAGVRWFPTNNKHKDLTSNVEWGGGKPIFICFEVQDTGRGLEQEEMNKLFSRFQQATERTHIKYGGSGLGLFISRELTETQGGEIGVQSEPGKGTTFAFYVKGRIAEAPMNSVSTATPGKSNLTPRQQQRQADQQKETQSPHENENYKKLTILLVEDNVVNAKILQEQLVKARCEVHVANHGMEALDHLSKSSAWHGMAEEVAAVSFDVILMDVEMPIMDGLTCTRRIRQLESEGKLAGPMTIIAITGNARQEQLDTVMQAGADGALPKPFRVKECIEKMKTLLIQNSNKIKKQTTP